MDARAYISLVGIQDHRRRERDTIALERLARRQSRPLGGRVGDAFVRVGHALAPRPERLPHAIGIQSADPVC